MKHNDQMIERIISELLKGLNRTVPIIGEKEFFYLNEQGTRIPLQRFLVREFSSRNGAALTQEEEDRMSKSGYYGLSLLKKTFPNSFSRIYREIVEENMEKITLSEPLQAFLEAARPALIITTSSFDILEHLLPKDYRSFYYSGNKDYDQGITQEDRKFRMDGQDHVIYHLFGRAVQYSEWVRSEVDLLQFLHKLHDGDTRPVALSTYLKDKGTLFLGCDFPDWLFRFLWYSISLDRDRKFNEEETVGYWMDGGKMESSFSDFLYDIKYQSQDQVDEILRALAAACGENRLVHDKPYDIFLSHAGEDKEWCMALQKDLESRGLKIWADYSEIQEDNYSDQFKAGIRSSRFFMPVVTEHYLRKFMPEEEWRQGRIVPLVEETEYALHIKVSLYPDRPYSLPVVKVGEKLGSIDINAMNLERISMGRRAILPPEFFYQQQFFFRCPEDLTKDTFEPHDWSRYKAINR